MEPNAALGGLIGVGDANLGFSADVVTFVSVISSSASGSYPSFSLRSASSFAFFSAASKSISSAPVSFFAPSFCVFFAPRTFAFRGPPEVAVLRTAECVIVRDAVGAASVSVFDRGVFARAVPFPFAAALRKGEAVRLMTGV